MAKLFRCLRYLSTAQDKMNDLSVETLGDIAGYIETCVLCMRSAMLDRAWHEDGN